ncbi:hypothetical protein C8J56DRAFT_475714 [Mycena floridula]|nr:hypothetical protein C8J56DRAFT_475714 [Mycena floridula]
MAQKELTILLFFVHLSSEFPCPSNVTSLSCPRGLVPRLEQERCSVFAQLAAFLFSQISRQSPKYHAPFFRHHSPNLLQRVKQDQAILWTLAESSLAASADQIRD